MDKLKHINLFYYGDKNDVYNALQKHYNRDSWYQLFWHIVFFSCAFGAIDISDNKEWLWIFGGMYALERAICRFIDNSNRNWFMHSIDWNNNERLEEKENES